jgi:hypothetical protein
VIEYLFIATISWAFDLAHRDHLTKLCERRNRDMLVFQKVDGFSANAFQRASLKSNMRDNLGDSLLRDAPFDRGHDHVALLDDRDPAYSFVLCEGLVVCRDQASDFRYFKFAQNFKP